MHSLNRLRELVRVAKIAIGMLEDGTPYRYYAPGEYSPTGHKDASFIVSDFAIYDLKAPYDNPEFVRSRSG